MSAWAYFRSLRLRHKALVVVTAPLWLPIALVAWIEDDRGGSTP